MSEKLSLKEERELIYLLLHHKEAIDSFFESGLSPNHFSEENQPVLLSIIDSYDRNGVLLTRKSFKEKLQLNTIPKERIAQELAFNSSYAASASMDDFPMLIQKVIDHNIDTSITKALEEFYKTSKKHGNVTAIKKLINDGDDIIKGSVASDEKSYYEDIRVLSQEQVKYIEDVRSGKIVEEPLILSGIREIDYAMVTGFERGTLTLFCADVGGFKSAIMLNIGLNVWNNGFDVLFVPLEMHRDQMWRRACSRESRVRLDLITRNIKDLSDEQMEKIKDMNKKWEENPAKFYMMQEPGNTTVVKIQRQIERNIELVKPRLVVIDYIANLEAHKNRYGRNDLEIGDMLKTMRQMGKDLNFAVLSAAQLGREALKRLRNSGANRDKTSINSEDIRGSHEYSADADNIFAQLISVSQPSSLLDIFCVKSRNGPTVFENGKIRATLDMHPEFGLIASSPYEQLHADDPEKNEENETYIADVTNLMDKTEKDGVVVNKVFEEQDDLYENSYSAIIDNKDIEDSIDEEELDDWNDDF